MANKPEALELSDLTSDVPKEINWCDRLVKTDRPLTAKQITMIRMIYNGHNDEAISNLLGIPVGRVTLLRSSSRIKAEVEKYSEAFFERPIQQRIDELAPDAMAVIERIITTDDPNVSLKFKRDTAIWLLEHANLNKNARAIYKGL